MRHPAPCIRGVLATLALLACGAVHADGNHEGAAAGFAALEQRLLGADRLCVRFRIESGGAVESDLTGTGRFERRGKDSLLQATGTFAGNPVHLTLTAGDDGLRLGTEDEARELPGALHEALVIGLTRMGLLHNLAMLSAGLPPDHGDGGAADWVQAGDVEGGPPGGPYRFVVVVAGQPSGVAELSLDERGLPLERTQRVEFPEGAMTVVERYQRFEPDCPAGD